MGLLQIWNDILSTKGETILCWTNQETENLRLGFANENFIKKRIQRGIKIRVLAINNKRGEELKNKDKESLRETKLLPKTTHFTTETYIYGNKVAILDYTKDIIGVVMESLPITTSRRATFELVWSSLI
jgi:hypothetical protein